MKISESIKKIINPRLFSYITNNVIPIYEKNDGGHGVEHIENVIKRIFDLNEILKLGLDSDMIFTIAAYHDITRYINDEEHEVLSAKHFLDDKEIRIFFTEEELKLIAEAIEDHRASLVGEPRSVYGKLISSADRTISIDTVIKRTHAYGLTHYPNFTLEQQIKRSYDHICEKFGNNGGYATKVYFDDGAYKKYLEDLNGLIKNYAFFKNSYLNINNIK